jgi:hypothetical protein
VNGKYVHSRLKVKGEMEILELRVQRQKRLMAQALDMDVLIGPVFLLNYISVLLLKNDNYNV